MNFLHGELTDKIIKAFYIVYGELGYGFLEKVYLNALLIELRKMGIYATKHQQIKVFYNGLEVGEYFADLVVENIVIIELKTAESIIAQHENQLLNYLKATDKEVGLLLNFGKKPEFKRKIFENKYK